MTNKGNKYKMNLTEEQMRTEEEDTIRFAMRHDELIDEALANPHKMVKFFNMGHIFSNGETVFVCEFLPSQFGFVVKELGSGNIFGENGIIDVSDIDKVFDLVNNC